MIQLTLEEVQLKIIGFGGGNLDLGVILSFTREDKVLPLTL